MDIVDSQVHLNKIGIDEGLAAMTALGIHSLVIDEYEDSYGGPGSETYAPYVIVGGGIPRPVQPVAEAAARRHPDRLAYLVRVEQNDPDLSDLVRLQKASGAKALRSKALTPREIAAFRNGEYNILFAAACEAGLPVFLALREVAELRPYLEEFTRATVILDHCGLPTNAETFERVLDLARHPNLYVKWAHAPRFFNSTAYPFAELHDPLRSLVDAYGANRIMWASDATEIKHRWAEDLYFIKDNPILSDEEKAWILGRTCRHVLNWPAPDRRDDNALLPVAD